MDVNADTDVVVDEPRKTAPGILPAGLREAATQLWRHTLNRARAEATE